MPLRVFTDTGAIIQLPSTSKDVHNANEVTLVDQMEIFTVLLAPCEGNVKHNKTQKNHKLFAYILEWIV